MFKKISKRIERIFDVVAPRASENDNEDEAMSPQERRDESLARQLQDEEDTRLRMLKAQYDAEEQASKHGEFSFAKRQRVSYHHRGSGLNYGAVIIGVHSDDGPEKPYYVSKCSSHGYLISTNYFHRKISLCDRAAHRL